MVWEVDIESEAEGKERHAEPYRGEVLPRLLNEDAGRSGNEGEGEHEGEGVYSRKDRGGEVDRLEVERKEVGACDEDGAVAEVAKECGDVGALFEEAEGHDGVAGELPFVDEEEKDRE